MALPEWLRRPEYAELQAAVLEADQASRDVQAEVGTPGSSGIMASLIRYRYAARNVQWEIYYTN